MKVIFRLVLLVLSVSISSLINYIYIDQLLDVFSIMSPFALLANRVALALLIYFLLDLILIARKIGITSIANKLFFIYLIWLLGLLFGRLPVKHHDHVSSRFNFTSFLPKWMDYLNHPLVAYYIFGNIFVYMPLGMYIRYNFRFIKSIFIFCLTILLFEILQAITALGYFDIDDLFLNGIGGFFGIIVMHTYKKIKMKY